MPFPAAVAICENDLRLDQTLLKGFAATTVDLRVAPLHGGTLDTGTIRLVRGQIDAMRKAGVPVGAVVVHHDVDRSSLAHAAQCAREALLGQPDFDRFYEDWKAAGLEKA